MAAQETLSWKDQLSDVRGRVVELERDRQAMRRLERERNESSLRERLKTDTPEQLKATFGEMRQRFDRAVRKFCPWGAIEEVLESLTEFGTRLRFYSDCMRTFGKVFTASHKTTIKGLLGEIGDVQRGLDRQLKQWRAVKGATEKITFRPRVDKDNVPLVAVAKDFSERAHSIPLSIPSDYYAHEKDDFWVVDFEGGVLGYVKYWEDGQVLTFGMGTVEGVNFKKLVRGVLYKFCSDGPLAKALRAVRVRVSYVREVRFFTDMGFVRKETKGPSDWIYEREIG